MKTIFLIVLIKLAECMPPLPSLERPCDVCDTSNCGVARNCPNGYVKDACNCCDVCLRKEGEHCGGLDSSSGSCDTGLFCSIRHPFSLRNNGLPKELQTGKCEPDTCKSVTCRKHQFCTVKDAKPKCFCHKDCHKDADEPYCGLLNYKQYKNLCSLRREECETQSKIPFVPGKCKGCVGKNGTTHDPNTILEASNICERRRCSHGAWKKFVDPDCLRESGFNCSTGSRKHPPMQCRPGYFCKITKKSETGKYVDLGECKKFDINTCFFGDREYKVNETFVDTACTGFCRCHGMNGISCVSLCPPHDASCKFGQIKVEERREVSKDPQCSCPVKRCRDSAVVCKREKYAGPCMAYFERWYYDSQNKECKRFVYGGCRSNGNNFRSKEECEQSCKEMYVIEESVLVPPSPPRMTSFETDTFPKSIPYKPELSSKSMTIRGKITFDKPRNISSPSCLVVAFSENSKADVSAVVMETAKFDLSDYDTSEPYFYKVFTKKPADKELTKTYTVRACVHVGWCPSELSSVKTGDYLTTTIHPVKLQKEKDIYQRDLRLVCFNCEKQEEETEEEMMPPLIASDEIPDLTSDVFPDGGENPGPKFSDKMITLKGQIKLPHNVGVLPEKSCLTIKFEDISLADASSFTIATVEVNLSKSNIGRRFNYFLESKKPADDFLRMSYSLSATLNYGWCRSNSGNSWIRQGDYLTDTVHRVLLEKEVDEYVQDVDLICYSCPSDRGTEVDEIVAKVVEADVVETEIGGMGNRFGGGTAKGPKMSNNTITIRGNLLFPRNVGKLPRESCLTISFLDISEQDVAAYTISTINIDVSNLTIDKTFSYVINSLKPDDTELTSRYFDISATLNYGWCSIIDDTESLRYGDYFVDTVHSVLLEKNVSVYEKDITMVYNEPADKEGDADDDEDDKVVPLFNIYSPPKLGNTFSEVSGLLNFKKAPGKVPTGSCLKLSFVDTTRADGPPFVIKRKTKNIEGEEIGSRYSYVIGFSKPEESELFRTYEMNAVLNIGWCSTVDDTEWIREGDYQTDVSFVVNLAKEYNIYTLDLNMTRFCLTPSCNTQLEKSCFDPVTNKTYTGDEQWQQDDCTTCRCSSNSEELVCAVADCFFPMLKECKNLVYTPGVCCPTCADPRQIRNQQCFDDITNKTYDNEEEWKRSSCVDCRCINGEIFCFAKECPMLDCLSGAVVKVKGQCCSVCKRIADCYDPTLKAIFQNGESWQPDDCTSCTCDEGEKMCAIQDCAPSSCDNPVNKPGKCCPECPERNLEKCQERTSNVTHKEGESWVEDNGCVMCTCVGGQSICASPTCALPDCPDGDVINVKGICCPVCSSHKVCTDPLTKRLYTEGKVWQNDMCLLCECTSDGMVCNEPNEDIKDCSSVVRMNNYCKKICLDKPETDP